METNLQHHFLIAMPNIKNSIFEKTVIYICEHNEHGTMGIIINKKIKKITIKNILTRLKIESSYYLLGPRIKDYVIMGGPEAKDKGFILHSSQTNFYSSMKITNNTIITTSQDILESIGKLDNPNHMLITLGYCAWDKNQLEHELLKNIWLTIPANHNILFHTPMEQKWLEATKQIGIDIYKISSQYGNA